MNKRERLFQELQDVKASLAAQEVSLKRIEGALKELMAPMGSPLKKKDG